MLFALVFFVNKEPPEKKVFVRKGLAYSTVGALLKTSIDCENPNYAGGVPDSIHLLDACADDKFGFSNFKCENDDGNNICEFTRGEMEKLLEQTLGKWNKNYKLTIDIYPNVGDRDPTHLFEPITSTEEGIDPCPTEQDSSGLFPLQIRELGSIMETELILCD